MQKCKNAGGSLGQLDMQLCTSTEAIDYSEETRNQRLRYCIWENNNNMKIAIICDLWKLKRHVAKHRDNNNL